MTKNLLLSYVFQHRPFGVGDETTLNFITEGSIHLITFLWDVQQKKTAVLIKVCRKYWFSVSECYGVV